MTNFVDFMRASFGRLLRIVLGVALLIWGFSGAGWIVALLGVVVIAAGTINFCIFAPLFGLTLWGKPRGAH